MFNGTLTGRLGADPEHRTTSGGKPVTKLRVATDHGFGDKRTTTWVQVACFGPTATWAATGLAKGDQVVVAGDVYAEDWTDKQGAKRTTVCLDASRVEKVYAPKGDTAREPAREPARGGRGGAHDDGDDFGVPF